MHSTARHSWVLFVGLLAQQAGLAASDRPPIGSQIGNLEIQDTRYLRRSLKEPGESPARVVVAVNTSCPLVRRYLPVLSEMEREYRERGVAFVALGVDASDTIIRLAALQVDSGAEFPFVKDLDGDCAAALGLERTPEVVVLDRDHRLRYRGCIDDQFRLTGGLPAPRHEPLRQALDQLLAGESVSVPETLVDGCLITRPVPTVAATPPSYSRQIAPLVQRACQNCHRPGDAAPFPLGSHADLASHAAMIAEVVAERRMPPWYGAESSVPFKNHLALSDSERTMLLSWIAAGCPHDAPGLVEPELAPAPRWKIGEPDQILTMLETHEVPATGIVPYHYVLLPHVFTEDTWVSAIEIAPDHPEVVHHANLGFARFGEKVTDDNFLTGRVPGGDAMTLPDGAAVLIPKGCVIGLQIHYTTTGTPVTSRLSVGLKFPRTPVQKRLYFQTISNRSFEIPPFAPAHEVRAERTIDHDAIGVGMFSHMHVRGRDMRFVAHTPDGRSEQLLLIPNYNFDWQQSYQWIEGGARFPAGTRFEVVAHFDNSEFNPFNPDPTARVRHGLQTEDEMMYGFVFYLHADEELNLTIDPATGLALKAAAAR